MFGLDQDQLVPGSKVLQHVDDFDIEALRFHSLEHRETVALHASPYVLDGEDVGTAHDAVGLGGARAEEGKRKQEPGDQSSGEGEERAHSPASVAAAKPGVRAESGI
jgi:hypothetical protein